MQPKKFLVALAMLSLLALSARAEVGAVNVLSAGTLTNNATRTTGFTDVKIDRNEVVACQVNLQGDQAGTGAITLTWARSKDGSTFETTPRFTVVTALNGNTAVVAFTNLTALTGAAHSLRLISAQNADASASATNVTISIVKKTVKSD